MMSIGIVKSGADIYKYFIDKDNYYLTDKSSLKDAATWHGKGAVMLEIAGKSIDEQQFLKLLEGKLPNGQQIGLMRDGTIKHRPATDITFSAPKSLSIMALVAGDQRLIEAHNKAVMKALDKIEALYAEARITQKGITTYEKTNNLTIATFRHTTSRELDAQLHTHCVVINTTQRQDKQWRALSSRQKNDLQHVEHGFRENLYANQHYLGMIYTSELAKSITEAGYEITIKDKHGNFEINGLLASYLQSQSKRRTQIEAVLAQKGLSGAKAADIAAVDSRQNKISTDLDTLKAYWIKDAKTHDVNLDQVYQQSLNTQHNQKITTSLPPLVKDAQEAITDAITHLSQYTAQLRHGDIIRQAFIFGAGRITHEQLEAVIANKIKSGQLLGRPHEHYATQSLIKIERALEKQFKESKGQAFSRDIHCSGIVADALRHQDRLQVIDVRGLKNEATLVDNLVKTAENNNLNAYVLHSNLSRLNRLKEDVSRDQSSFWRCFKNFFKHDLLQTVGQFTQHYQHKIDHQFFRTNKNDLIIATDAQKLSYKDIQILDALATQGKAKIIFLNNMASTQGFSAGNPIKILKETGVAQFISSAKIPDTLIEVAESAQGKKDLAQYYMSLKHKESVPVVVFSNKAQSETTEEIRSTLQQARQLSLQEMHYNTLSSKGLSEVEKTKPHCYHLGDQVTFNANTKDYQSFLVTGIDKSNQTLSLISVQGKQRTLILNQSADSESFAVKKTQNLKIAVGETLRATRNIYIEHQAHQWQNKTTLKIDKNSTFIVDKIDQNGITINYNNQPLLLTKEKLKYSFIDHGYVIKPHQLEKDCEHALTVLSGYQVNQNNMGEIAEFAQKVTLFTDNPEKSIQALHQQNIAWTAIDVASKKINQDYAPIVRTEQAIRNDLKAVAQALCPDAIDKNKQVKSAVAYGMAKVAEHEAGFSRNDILKAAMHYAIGQVSSTDIEKVIKEKEQQGTILVGNTAVTTPYVYQLEKNIITNITEGHNQITPVFEVSPDLEHHLTQGQKDAITLALTTTDRFIGINGVAGSGKTTMMQQVKTLAEAKGYQLVGIAPTHKTVQMLNDSMNPSSNHPKNATETPVMTAHRFISQDTSSKYNDKTIFIVDECAMLGNRLYNDIQNKVIDFKARAIYAGDIGQHTSIEHGKPQELAINHGLKTAYMDEIVRQSNPKLKTSAILASQKQSGAALRNLESINPSDYVSRTGHYKIEDYQGSFIEIGVDKDENGKPIKSDSGFPSLNNLYTAVVNDWLSRPQSQRDQTIIVAYMHIFRQEIDTRIREGLTAEGLIQNPIQTQRLVSKNFDSVDLLLARNYKTKDIVRFDKTYSIAKKGDHMKVTEVDKAKNMLTLTNLSDGNQYTINPAKLALKANMSVYDAVKTELGIGDRIRLRATDKTKGWLGGREYQVKTISEKEALLVSDKGQLTIKLNDPKDQLWEYAYTHTSYSVQGASSKYMIGLEINDNYRSNYIQITRAKEHLSIYTIDKNWLINHLTDAQKMMKADKTSAYEVMHGHQKQVSSVINGAANTPINHLTPLPESLAYQKKPSDVVKNHPANNSPRPSLDDQPKAKPLLANDLKPMLRDRIEELAIHLLGQPNKQLSNRKYLRYGKNGSLIVNLEKGQWFSHEEGKGGNAFDLIQRELQLQNFKDTLAYAKTFLNVDTTTLIPVNTAKIEQIKTQGTQAQTRIKNYATRLYKQSQPIQHTLGEKYLNNRGLVYHQNANLRFLPEISGRDKDNQKTATPAILAFAKDKENQINHVQIIRLDATGNKSKAVSIPKQIFGSLQGHAIELNQQPNPKVTYLAEGIETGLSLLQTDKKSHVMAVLGKSNFANINLDQLADKVILCLDHDGSKLLTDHKIHEAVERLQSHGKQVGIIMPETPKYDFNDVLQKQGLIALHKQANNIISPQHYQSMLTEQNKQTADVTHILQNDAMNLQNSQQHLTKKEANYINNDHEITDTILKNIGLKNIDNNQQYHALDQQLSQEKIALSRIKNNLAQAAKQEIKIAKHIPDKPQEIAIEQGKTKNQSKLMER